MIDLFLSCLAPQVLVFYRTNSGPTAPIRFWDKPSIAQRQSFPPNITLAGPIKINTDMAHRSDFIMRPGRVQRVLTPLPRTSNLQQKTLKTSWQEYGKLSRNEDILTLNSSATNVSNASV